jgi:hypothetical protein
MEPIVVDSSSPAPTYAPICDTGCTRKKLSMGGYVCLQNYDTTRSPNEVQNYCSFIPSDVVLNKKNIKPVGVTLGIDTNIPFAQTKSNDIETMMQMKPLARFSPNDIRYEIYPNDLFADNSNNLFPSECYPNDQFGKNLRAHCSNHGRPYQYYGYFI